MEKEKICFTVNGEDQVFEIGRDIESDARLSTVLREKLGLTGVRISCEQGACGACTVLLDGKSVLSCMMFAVDADGREVTTIEAFGESDPVASSFIEMAEPGYGTAMQCGFCTPGFVLEAHALLSENASPAKDEIKEALSGHICRCGCYHGIIRAVENAAEKIREVERR
ncbi:MAG: (2Fe-2S)-binding protein [Clostridiales Family XIII bacterium]|jgi:carbon-monoxide dehydrogenase small subunit|nr:(2Fe-2S)-binding protein [Clostridiales Family XIII bacterium]